MKIIPAILTGKQEEFFELLSVCEKFTDYAQIDIMDGEFVPSQSITAEDLSIVTSPKLRSEAHLMVKDPLSWVDTFFRFGSERIIYHFEACNDHKKVISQIKAKGLSVGLAVNPPTQIEDFEYLIEFVDIILFLSVIPGFYGSAFIPSVLNKIEKFKKLFPYKSVGIDGGVKLGNVCSIAQSGVDHIYIGSALLKRPNPMKAYQEFMRKVGE